MISSGRQSVWQTGIGPGTKASFFLSRRFRRILPDKAIAASTEGLRYELDVRDSAPHTPVRRRHERDLAFVHITSFTVCRTLWLERLLPQRGHPRRSWWERAQRRRNGNGPGMGYVARRLFRRPAVFRRSPSITALRVRAGRGCYRQFGERPTFNAFPRLDPGSAFRRPSSCCPSGKHPWQF